MNQEKIGKTIKEIRQKSNLTQSAFAEKYNVTYQAVSKWENGKNLPDMSLLKQICDDYNIDINDLLDGNLTPIKNKSIKKRIIAVILLIIICIITIILLNKKNNFEFKTLTANCDHFNITGSIAYNDKKSSIYISSINYCGGTDNTEYTEIECILCETNNLTETKIDSIIYNQDDPILLEEFLSDTSFHIDNYIRTCHNYKENTLSLLINATDKNGKITTYKIPLSLKDNCD